MPCMAQQFNGSATGLSPCVAQRVAHSATDFTRRWESFRTLELFQFSPILKSSKEKQLRFALLALLPPSHSMDVRTSPGSCSLALNCPWFPERTLGRDLMPKREYLQAAVVMLLPHESEISTNLCIMRVKCAARLKWMQLCQQTPNRTACLP